MEDREVAVDNLMKLYQEGDRRAGCCLVMLVPGFVTREIDIPLNERISLVLEQARGGDVAAALELVHVYRKHIAKETLSEILVRIANKSAEASELLLEIRGH